jgi:azurin
LAGIIERAADDSARVRIEALAALSYFNSDSAAVAAENVLKLPTDYYLNYTARETLKYLRPKLGAGSRGAMWLDSLQKIDDEAAAKQAAADKPVEKNVFEISTLPAKMLFDKEEIVLPARTSVIIRFKNPDEMPHNFVIIKKGSLVKVGKAADAMAATKDGFAKSFIPNLPEVLFATPLVDPGKSFDLEFYTPVAGEYEFVCSFPGHWNMMKGIIRFLPK